MARIVVTANVEDLVKWEEGFRTHGDLFRSQTVSGSIGMATTEENDVAVCFEAENLDTFLEVLNSSATADAMALDGVNRDSVKVFVMDKEFTV